VILLTVGTERFQFDRLIQAFDEQCADASIGRTAFAQIGSSTFEPRNVDFARFLPFDELQDLMRRANLVVAHAGSGTLLSVHRVGKPCLAVPRLHRHGEHVDDHQLDIATRFDNAGIVRTVFDLNDLPELLRDSRQWPAAGTTGQPVDLALATHLESLIRAIEDEPAIGTGGKVRSDG